MLVLSISKDLDELFQNRCLAAVAPLGELGGVVVVTVDASFVLVVAVRGAENSRAYGAGKVLNVVFAVERCDVGAAQGLPAFVAKQIETPEIICFAEGVLPGWLVGDGKELGCNDFTAVLNAG
jgi:hypothetical protein